MSKFGAYGFGENGFGVCGFKVLEFALCLGLVFQVFLENGSDCDLKGY